MKVGAEVPCPGNGKEIIQPVDQVGHRIGHRAENTIAARDDIGDCLEGAAGTDLIDRQQAGGLQFDPVLPLFAHLAEHRPGNCVLWRQAVEMGADGAGSMRPGTFQRKFHAPRHVFGGPVGHAVGTGR